MDKIEKPTLSINENAEKEGANIIVGAENEVLHEEGAENEVLHEVSADEDILSTDDKEEDWAEIVSESKKVSKLSEEEGELEETDDWTAEELTKRPQRSTPKISNYALMNAGRQAKDKKPKADKKTTEKKAQTKRTRSYNKWLKKV